MDASEASTFNKAVDWYKGRGYWFSPPVVQFVDSKPTVATTGPDLWPALPSSYSADAKSTADGDGWSLSFPTVQSIYSVKDRLSSELAVYYRFHIRSHLLRLVREGHRKFGGLILEPVCLGAGGMVFVDPLFQACLVEVVRASGDLFGGDKWDGSSYETSLKNLPGRDAKDWQGLPVIYDEGRLLVGHCTR
jgi:dethiobiotin synthetase/adenosylmethionine--8-amino-7-oxononanoate aminotransferase